MKQVWIEYFHAKMSIHIMVYKICFSYTGYFEISNSAILNVKNGIDFIRKCLLFNLFIN